MEEVVRNLIRTPEGLFVDPSSGEVVDVDYDYFSASIDKFSAEKKPLKRIVIKGMSKSILNIIEAISEAQKKLHDKGINVSKAAAEKTYSVFSNNKRFMNAFNFYYSIAREKAITMIEIALLICDGKPLSKIKQSVNASEKFIRSQYHSLMRIIRSNGVEI